MVRAKAQRPPGEMRSWHEEWSELRDLRALRGDKLLDHEGREAHEGRDTKKTNYK